jgi:hypothetical protein
MSNCSFLSQFPDALKWFCKLLFISNHSQQFTEINVLKFLTNLFIYFFPFRVLAELAQEPGVLQRLSMIATPRYINMPGCFPICQAIFT